MSANLFGNFLTVATLPLVILMVIIYYSKDQFNTARNKLYKIMLFTILEISVTEILLALAINYETVFGSAARMVLEVISRIHFAGATFWWATFVMYTIAVFEHIKSTKLMDVIKYNKATIGISIFYVIVLILVLVVPQLSVVANVDINKIEYFPIKQVYIPSLLVTGVEIVLAIYYIIKTRKNNELTEDRSVLYTIIIITRAATAPPII